MEPQTGLNTDISVALEGDVVIVDPCYITGCDNKEHIDVEYEDIIKDFKGICATTIIGDGCFDVLTCDKEGLITGSIGGVSVDSGTVAVLKLDDILSYNAKWDMRPEKSHTSYGVAVTSLYTLVRGFKGTARFFVMRSKDIDPYMTLRLEGTVNGKKVEYVTVFQ